HTTEFAVMYLPAEGLYAEVLRDPGLVEQIQREQRIMLAGPTTLAALLNALQVGFQAHVLKERSGC
ncbi:MAG: DNA recombination protein RmuC, partial [Deltaproteobacteria bacterium]|nr:DNA recombination protein RmuC [Deltaproteobacteria bacterium]